jgi:hypothetical protein
MQRRATDATPEESAVEACGNKEWMYQSIKHELIHLQPMISFN